MKSIFLPVVALFVTISTAPAAVIISEVHSTGSAATYASDWFELTNTGTSAVDLTGWRIDDSSNLVGSAAPLTGVLSISPGQSVIFIEGSNNADPLIAAANTAATIGAFTSAWFGTNVPTSFLIGSYSGNGLGFSGNGDAVNIFDASSNPVTSVTFGAGTLGTSFDNFAGLTGTIGTLSVVGVNGAFTSVTGGEIGSPGNIVAAAIPEPSSLAIVGLVSGIAAWRRRRVARNA